MDPSAGKQPRARGPCTASSAASEMRGRQKPHSLYSKCVRRCSAVISTRHCTRVRMCVTSYFDIKRHVHTLASVGSRAVAGCRQNANKLTSSVKCARGTHAGCVQLFRDNAYMVGGQSNQAREHNDMDACLRVCMICMIWYTNSFVRMFISHEYNRITKYQIG